MNLTPQDAARHLLRLKAAEDSFLGWVRLHFPQWDLPDFHLTMIDALDRLEKNVLDSHFNLTPAQKDETDCVPVRNILITMPPRHGKSTYGSVIYPSYFMSRKPSRFLMSTSYNSQLATDFGRQVRSLVNEPLTAQAYPDFEMSPDSRAVDQWRTTAGGAAYFIGVGGTTSGRAANMLLFDDPFKSREEAESATQRNKVWNYYVSALSTRLQPDIDNIPPAQIIILTRWHPDDLAGRLMETEDWKEGRWLHINFPSIQDKPIDGLNGKVSRASLPPEDPQYLDGTSLQKLSKGKRYVRKTIKTALWPERFSVEDLERRQRLNPREFASLYQQTPYIEGGNLIRANWWRTYPEDMKPEKFSSLIISADTAFKAKQDSDYSVMMVLGLDTTGDIYVVDLIRDRFEFPELKRRMIQLNNVWRGRGLRGIYIEDKASGQSLIQEMQRESGVSIIPYKVVNDKVSRLTAILPLIEGGRVLLPTAAPWLDAFHEECQSFPSGKHDDMVDALAIGLDVLARTPTTGEYYQPPAFALPKPSDSLWAQRSDLNNSLGQWRGWGE
jgi:predicted phage terminase large subunit-like protein